MIWVFISTLVIAWCLAVIIGIYNIVVWIVRVIKWWAFRKLDVEFRELPEYPATAEERIRGMGEGTYKTCVTFDIKDLPGVVTLDEFYNLSVDELFDAVKKGENEPRAEFCGNGRAPAKAD